MIKTGILGTTETACNYAGIIKQSPNFELTGCFSPDYNKTKSFASDFNLLAYPSAEALFNYADALIITEFSPDFLTITEKALKNFKHVLITNPFLAGLEEINYLRKLSEESGVLMQISGGFKFQPIASEVENKGCFFADLKHSFDRKNNVWSGFKYMQILLNDISLLLTLLKGIPKKISSNSWELCDFNPEVLTVRIELDNGCVANLLVSTIESSNNFELNVYGTEGILKFGKMHSDIFERNSDIVFELNHFSKNIENSYFTTQHHDIMFQALNLVHGIKVKSSRYFSINIPD